MEADGGILWSTSEHREGGKEAPVSPNLSSIEGSIVDLCAQVEAQMGELRRDYQLSVYEVCLGIENRISKEMDKMVYHVRRLIDQNAFLYDRVVELEKRDDAEKISSRAGDLHDLQKGEKRVHLGGSEELAPVQRRGPGGRMYSAYRQAG
jgi:hypothetical protein